MAIGTLIFFAAIAFRFGIFVCVNCFFDDGCGSWLNKRGEYFDQITHQKRLCHESLDSEGLGPIGSRRRRIVANHNYGEFACPLLYNLPTRVIIDAGIDDDEGWLLF